MIDNKKLSDLNANFNEGQIYSHSELRVFLNLIRQIYAPFCVIRARLLC